MDTSTIIVNFFVVNIISAKYETNIHTSELISMG